MTVDAYESEVDLEVRLGYTLDTTYTRKQTSYDPPRRIRILPNRHLELTRTHDPPVWAPKHHGFFEPRKKSKCAVTPAIVGRRGCTRTIVVAGTRESDGEYSFGGEETRKESNERPRTAQTM